MYPLGVCCVQQDGGVWTQAGCGGYSVGCDTQGPSPHHVCAQPRPGGSVPCIGGTKVGGVVWVWCTLNLHTYQCHINMCSFCDNAFSGTHLGTLIQSHKMPCVRLKQ